MVKYLKVGNARCYAGALCESGDILYKCTSSLAETEINVALNPG